MVLRRWLEDAQGRLGLTAAEFWRTTLAEYMAHVAGWNRAQTGGIEPMTRERFEELEREYGAPSKSIRTLKR